MATNDIAPPADRLVEDGDVDVVPLGEESLIARAKCNEFEGSLTALLGPERFEEEADGEVVATKSSLLSDSSPGSKILASA